MCSFTKQALEIVDAALELVPDRRPAYLDQACPDRSLRQYVDLLLSSYGEAEDFLSEPALITHANVLDSEPVDAWIGRQIGPYRLIEEIGEGGMGLVYRAVRVDKEYQKEVAIKLLRSSLDSASTLIRFKAERQILAGLEHPNIARLLDGGATADGVPYFVMELVDGSPIDDYCDSHKLTTLERLQLFRGVCSAVQYAHDHSVVHRDLKPSNVFVTNDGVPKLLDFGIAKILDPESFPETAIEPTRTMMRVLTPEYASPEQMRGEATGPASDVYSLGVMLYIILTGHRPYDLHGSAPHEIAKRICEIVPQKPSDAVSRTEEIVKPDGKTETLTPEKVSSCRDNNVDKLRRRLAGDLDNIALKALRKEPLRRYASPNEFSEDIRRHLEDLPVHARREAAFYRLGKFIHRNVPMVGASFLLLLTVAVGLGSFAWLQHSRNKSATTKVGHVNIRPSIAVLGFKNLSGRKQSAWISTALSEMLNTELAAGEKLRTVPGENIARMKTDLVLADSESYSPDTLQRIRTNIGADYVVVGSYLEQEADSKARVRLDVRLQDANAGEIMTSVSESGGESDLSDIVARTAKSLRMKLAVGEAATAETSAVRAALPTDTTAARFYAEGLNKLRNFDAQGARHSLEQAVTVDPQFALAHSALAAAWSQLGYDANAAREAKRAFDLSSGLSREDHLAVEANFREMNREWGKAADIYKVLCSFFPDSLDYGLRLARVQTLGGNGKDALLTAETLRRLPAPAGDDPRIDLAEAQAAKSVTDYRRMQAAAISARNKGQKLGARMVIARAGLAEAVALRGIGNSNESVAKAKDAQSLFLQYGDHEGAASALNDIGNVLSDQGDSAGGEKAYQEALAIYQEIGNRAGWAGALGNIAILKSDAGDIAGAERLYAQVLRADEEIGDQQSVAETLLNMANNLNTQGDFDGALKLYRRSLKISQETNYHHNAASALNNMGVILTAQGQIKEAVQAFEEALRLHRQYSQEGSLLYPLEGLGDVLQAKGDLPGAKSKLQEALEVLRRTGQRDSESWILADLGDVCFAEGDFATAKSNYEKAMELDQAANYKDHLNGVRVQLAELKMEQGQLAEAETLTSDALREFEAEKSRDGQVAAYSVRMLVLLSQQKPVDAQRDAEKAATLAQGMQNRYVQTKLAIAGARVDAASGRSAAATRILVNILAQTEKYGFLLRQYQARLALGEIELKTGHLKAARERLQSLETEATSKGFGLVARKAASALQSLAS